MYQLLIIFFVVYLIFRGVYGVYEDIKILTKRTWNSRKSVKRKKRAEEYERIRCSLEKLKVWGKEIDDIYAGKSREDL